jgi:general stress protein YciG
MEQRIEATPPKRGFAAMDPARRREIARKGGLSVPSSKRSFAASRALAASAGSKGGRNVESSLRTFAKDRQLASHAGRKGRRRRDPE